MTIRKFTGCLYSGSLFDFTGTITIKNYMSAGLFS